MSCCDWCGGSIAEHRTVWGKNGHYCCKKCLSEAGDKEKPGIGCLPIIIIGVIIFIFSLIDK